MSKIKIGLAQLNSNDDVVKNVNQVLEIIDCIETDVDIVFFPENALFFRIDEVEPIQYLELESEELKSIAKKCAEKKVYVHLGSISLIENGVPSNSSVLITPSQKIIKAYSKLHLFDIQLNQEKAIRESDCFRRGEAPFVFQLKGWRFGQSICYDLRFSELYRFYNSLKVDVLLIPAAFLKKTGTAHWHVLNRARAIENQCYVVSSAQKGPHFSRKNERLTRETYGHALCVSPWGEVLVDLDDAPAVQVIELDRTQIENVKKQIPMDSHRCQKSVEWIAGEIFLEGT
ncbi:MAG: carbon-nitrogen hydrolase family protein [Bdellovibrionaceae bacterium]|nr:carbon-nitrogen hydrolase family protein [Pseudobdellovibrionaceae bacterium]